jgi:hypothetical protein
MTLTSAINIIPGQSGTYRHLQRRFRDLLAESGLPNRTLTFRRLAPMLAASLAQAPRSSVASSLIRANYP